MGERETGERDRLPAGWGPWTQDEDGAMNLSRTGHRYSVRAYRSGEWKLWDGTTYGPRVTGYAKPRTMAAAQREATRALWCCDGYGTGEVRGVLVTGDPSGSGVLRNGAVTYALPGLPGRWAITAERPVPGGIEVDARKVGASAGDVCLACGSADLVGIGCGSCGWTGEPIATPESEGTDEPRDPEASVHREVVRNVRAFPLRRVDPVATGDADELARLMPCRKCNVPFAPPRGGGSHRCPSCGTRNGEPPGEALAFAALCQLAERIGPAIGPNQRRACVEARDDLAAALRERETLRARVAELEAMLTAPPVGSVAGLLAKVDEARSVASSKGANHAGESAMAYRYEGMRDAFDIARDLIRSALAAPTDPMGKVAAEVLAVDVADVIPSTVETIGDHAMVVADFAREVMNDRAGARGAFVKAARVCIAAALACDAAKGGSHV